MLKVLRGCITAPARASLYGVLALTAPFATPIAPSASAATILTTQTLDFSRNFSINGFGAAPGGSQTLAFNLFDGDPSRLRSVAITWAPGVTGTINGRTGNSFGNATVNGALSGTVSLSSSSGAFTTITNAYTTNTATRSVPGRTTFTLGPVTATPAPTDFTSPTLDINNFVGAGTSNLLFSISNVNKITSGGGLTQFNGHSGTAGGTFSLTYEIVPEPTTWAMLIAGFGLTGAAMRRRRRTSLAA